MKKIWLIAFAGMIVVSCTNKEERKEEASPADTVKTETSPAAKADTIEIYRYKGSEAIINTDFISKASEAEKAVIAYYCYVFNTSCENTRHCRLTEALGLGEQNSKEQQELVKKYFNDSETRDLVKQGGTVTPNGSENLSWFESLRFIKDGTSRLEVLYISNWVTKDMHGKGKGTDEYELEKENVKVVSRNHEELDIQ